MSEDTRKVSSARKPSMAKLAIVPSKERSKSVGRSLWSRMNIFSEVAMNSTTNDSKKSPPSGTSRSKRSNNTPSSTHGSSSSRQSRSNSKTSNINRKETVEEVPIPMPRKTSLGRSSLSESDSRNLSSLDPTFGRDRMSSSSSFQSSIHSNSVLPKGGQKPLNHTNEFPPKKKTTVIVHMSKNNQSTTDRSINNSVRNHSSQDLVQDGVENFSQNSFDSNSRNSFPKRSPIVDQRDHFLSQRSLSSVIDERVLHQRPPSFERPSFDRRPSEPDFVSSSYLDSWNQTAQEPSPLWTPQFDKRRFPISNNGHTEIPFDHRRAPLPMRREKTDIWTPTLPRRNTNARSDFRKINNWSPVERNMWSTGKMNAQHRSMEDILSLNQNRQREWNGLDAENATRSRSTWYLGRDNTACPSAMNNQTNFQRRHMHNYSSSDLCNQQNDSPQLNSLLVHRQSKYKDRHMAERKIKHQHHLHSNEDCNELVQILGKEFYPSMYENSNPLDFVQRETKSNIITSSRNHILADRIPMKPKFPLITRDTGTKEHIYAEIDETISPFQTPVMHRRVTFSTTHDPVAESDSSFVNKKILPATLWGVVEVKSALREKKDEERRGIARLCYHAVKMASPNNSLKFLGKIDRSRYGESVYVVLENGCFEVRDGEGLIIAKHKSQDISVVTEIAGDANVFVYIGRCKFGGRIGMVLKFNKCRHIGIVIEFFKNG